VIRDHRGRGRDLKTTKWRSKVGDVLVREGSGLTFMQGESIYFR
jgi:hypothetical protein